MTMETKNGGANNENLSDCISPENLVTYFCGGTKDTYKLTTSKKLTVVYSGRPSKASKKERTFKMVINAGLQPSFPPPPPPPPVVILVIDDGGAGQSRDDVMVIVVGAVLIVIVLVLIPAVIKMVKKKVRPPTVTPTGPSLSVDIDFTAMGATDLPPPYPGSPAPMEATLGLPQFPRQPSAVSLGETDMTDIPSLDNLDDSEMQTSIMPTPSPRSGQLPSLKTEDSPKRKKKKRKTSILETDLDNVGKVAKGKKDKMKKK